MRTSGHVGLLLCLLQLASCGRDQRAGGGFAGDTRPTFQKENPYEAVSRVEWRAWSEETLARADDRKPVLLDLSGLWCHWCHIFDVVIYGDAELAAFIRKNFIPVRVDPDARPDIDLRYNRGSWPTVCLLTPEGDIVSGTTFTTYEGFMQFLENELERYRAHADSLRTALKMTRERVARAQAFLREEGELDADARRRVLTAMKERFDMSYGGFLEPEGDGSKIALPDVMGLLLQDVQRGLNVDPEVEAFVDRTLNAMAHGAVRDHLFGGFFRGVGNRSWSQPHFEKFLDAQANMVNLYLRASLRREPELYRGIARETLEFVMAYMANPDTVTFSNAIDPDLGPGDDGSFYTWTAQEVDTLLSTQESRVIRSHYGIALHGELPNRPHENTLLEANSVAETAKRLEMETGEVTRLLDQAKARMRAYRLAGPMPRVDATAYAAPNLRFASALLTAAEAFREPRYRERGLGTIDFFTQEIFRPTEGVPHAWNGREATGPMLFQNQVAAIEACLRAFESTADERYLTRARDLYGLTQRMFRNEVTGAFWDLSFSETGPGRLVMKIARIDDNVRLAESVMDLYVATAEDSYRQEAEQMLRAFCRSYAAAGWDAIGYALAVDRLIWGLKVSPS